MRRFLPIILGSDENAYGCARMFYEISGERSLLLCSRALLPCDNSGILTRRVIKDFDTGPVFENVMNSVLSSLKNEAEKLLIIPCSDYYAELVVNNSEKISKYAASPILSKEVYGKICGKIKFAALCAEMGIPHPETKAALPSALVSGIYPDKYPVVVKPMNSNSSEYLKSTIPGKKKVYICAPLGGNVQHALGFGKVRGNLGEQRALADAGVAADEHQRAGHDAAAEHGVEFRNAGGYARQFFFADLREGQRAVERRAALALCLFFWCGRFREFFHQRAEFSAAGAPAQPLRALRPAFGAYINRFRFCHFVGFPFCIK